jgi:hypothetical protein
MDAKEKAGHLAETFQSKYKTCNIVDNHYARIEPTTLWRQRQIGEVTEELAESTLQELRTDSATGPDQLPTRVLKECAHVLAKPLQKLVQIILAEGRWPEPWLIHWIVPLHKRNNVYSGKNYRGVHLTSQLSKAVERMLLTLFMPFLLKSNAFGQNQFAYTP